MAKRETKLLHSQPGDEMPTLRRLEAKTSPWRSASRRDTIDDLQATALSLYLSKRSNDDFHALLLLSTLYSLLSTYNIRKHIRTSLYPLFSNNFVYPQFSFEQLFVRNVIRFCLQSVQ